MARSRARARLNWVSQGQLWGRCRVRRRAERVIRPAREKNRRRRVLVVTTCSPRPVRAVQRARLCAITCIASQAALGVAQSLRRNGPTACGSAPRRTSGLEWRSRPRHGGGGRPPAPGFPVPVGDEAVIAVGGEEDQLGTGSGLHPPEMSRTGAFGLTLEGGAGWTNQAPTWVWMRRFSCWARAHHSPATCGESTRRENQHRTAPNDNSAMIEDLGQRRLSLLALDIRQLPRPPQAHCGVLLQIPAISDSRLIQRGRYVLF